MRILPQTLREKIEKANQTIFENADPHMDVLLRRARTGLTGTDLFYMQTIREGTDLEALGIDLQRTNVNGAPSKAFNIYIKDGICKVATKNLPSKVKEQWVDVLTIGPATACDIAFDGRWYRDDEYRWQLVTIGNPWLFYVTGGNLYAKQWTADPVLLAEGVSKISAIRAWKNTYMWNHDQGIIVAYIKSGVIYYRNYCQQPPDQPAIWEIERAIDLPTPAQNVALFRTNDYRTGFLCESNGQMYWTITARNWANMAIEPHFISAGITDVKVNFIPIKYTDMHLKHQITAGISDVGVNFCPIQDPQAIDVTTDNENTITIEFDMPLMEGTGQQNAFIVTDNGYQFDVLSTELGETPYFLVLHMEDFGGFASELNIAFRPIQDQIQVGMLRTQMTPNCIKQLTDFDLQVELAPPEGYTNHNISVGITDVSVNFKKIDYLEAYQQGTHAIQAGITDVSVTFIHIDDINP